MIRAECHQSQDEAYWQILNNFPFLNIVITTQNLCQSPWSSKLNLCKIPSLCISYFEIHVSDDIVKVLNLINKIFPISAEKQWLLGNFPARGDWISWDPGDALFWHDFLLTSWSVCSQSFLVLQCGIFHKLIFSFPTLLTEVKKAGFFSPYSADLLE